MTRHFEVNIILWHYCIIAQNRRGRRIPSRGFAIGVEKAPLHIAEFLAFCGRES
jgi:hypothetical protein